MKDIDGLLEEAEEAVIKEDVARIVQGWEKELSTAENVAVMWLKLNRVFRKHYAVVADKDS